MLPVPDASMPAVEICSERSAAGTRSSASETLKFGRNTTFSEAADGGVGVDYLGDIVDRA